MAGAATSFVRTVLGAIPAGQLGVCHAHEHIVIGPSFTTHETPDFLLDRVDRGGGRAARVPRRRRPGDDRLNAVRRRSGRAATRRYSAGDRLPDSHPSGEKHGFLLTDFSHQPRAAGATAADWHRIFVETP